MKQGLALRVSQQLALTPQLQQSIRLLQLSTLELSQEIDRLLDENPFLERDDDEAAREAFGVAQDDTPVSQGDRLPNGPDLRGRRHRPPRRANDDSHEADGQPRHCFRGRAAGRRRTVEVAPDDSEWGC